MEISEVRVSLCKVEDERLKAFANVTFDSCFVVRGIKVIQGTNGLFVAMPNRKLNDGTFQDVAHPINSEMRDRLQKAVLATYEKEINSQKSSSEPKV
ncbi:MAG: septation regulator SpoVG [Candidatus Edwardsbacteria bacterium]